MKIAIRRGHNRQATGSVGLVNEVIENENILAPTIKYLKQLGHEVLDVSPSDMTSASDLAYGVKKANDWGADIFVSIHCNKAYDKYNGAIGSECLVYSKTDDYKDEVIAQRIVNNLGALGFKNRGADALGKAIAEGIANNKVSTPSTSLIRVFKDDKQIGAFSSMANAIKAAEQAMSEGARIVRIEKV